MPQYVPTAKFAREPSQHSGMDAPAARPSIDRGVRLGMESRQVFYRANSSEKACPSRKIQCPEECQMLARKAMLGNFSKMFGF